MDDNMIPARSYSTPLRTEKTHDELVRVVSKATLEAVSEYFGCSEGILTEADYLEYLEFNDVPHSPWPKTWTLLDKITYLALRTRDGIVNIMPPGRRHGR